MARPKPADKVDSDGIELDSIYNAEALNPALESLYGELGIEGGTDATVFISKLQDDGDEYGVWKGDPDAYDLEGIAKKFGSGKYRVKVYVRIATGQKPCKANKVFCWQLSAEDEARYQAAMKAALNPEEKPVTQHQPDMKEIVQMMMSGFNAVIEKMAVTMRPQEQNALQSLEGIKQIAAMFQPKSAPSDMDAISKMIMAKAVEKLFEDKPPLTNADGEVSPMGVLMRGIDVVGNAIAQRKEMEAKPASQNPEIPSAPMPGIPAIATSAVSQQNHEDIPEMSEDQVKQAIKDQSVMACAMARANITPSIFSKSIYELAPDEVLEILAYDPQWFETLCNINPDCKEHEKWFRDCRDCVIAEMKKEGIWQDPLTVSHEGNTIDESQSIGVPHGDTGKP